MRGPTWPSRASRSLASASRCTLNSASPLTMVGLGGPDSSTSIFPSGMFLKCSTMFRRLPVQPRHHDAHQHDPHRVEHDLLEGNEQWNRRDHVINEVHRNDGKTCDGDAVADALRQP